MVAITRTGKFTRTRRTRRTESLRSLVRETRLDPAQFIYPMFVTHGTNVRTPIDSMPGQYQLSVDQMEREARELSEVGVKAVLLFGLPADKDPEGSELKRVDPSLVVVVDVCLCEYTDHGHCGLLTPTGEVDNDQSLALLSRMAVTCAEAGADVIAPSDMMDGRVGAIREALDEAGFESLPIMAYSAKYASGFYGPFREAAGTPPQFGDRRGYQMDPANGREARREVAADTDEWADITMVKPALAYLDVIRDVREHTDLPLAAYNVSGEYAMVKAAAGNNWIEERRIVLEILTAIARAGASIIITYHAKDAARWIREDRA